MNNLKFLIVAIFATIFISNCTKENLDTTTIEKEEIIPEEKTSQNSLLTRTRGGYDAVGLDLGCFVINLPFSLVDSEGSEYSITTIADFQFALDTNASTIIVDFVYPLEVTLNDEITDVENGENLAILFSECIPTEGWTIDEVPVYLIDDDNSCFNLSFPINVADLDGNVQTIPDEITFIDAISKEVLFFVYPINLIDSSGTEVIAENTSDFYDLILSCNHINTNVDSTMFVNWETGYVYLGCFKPILPFSVNIQGGSSVTVEDQDQLFELILGGSITAYNYPVNFEDENAEVITINSEEELNIALSNCFSIHPVITQDLLALLSGTFPSGTMGEPGCYEINWPIDIVYINENGENITISVNTEDEIFTSEYNITELVFPVTITLTSDGSEVIINNSEDILNQLDSCN